MVKVGIIGADTPLAGELIRILINHPETEIETLWAPSLKGRAATSLHHGLIGETPLFFTDKLDLEGLDLILLAEESDVAQKVANQLPNNENLKLVSPNKKLLSTLEGDEFLQAGLSEYNRKALVRVARAAYLVSPVLVPAIVALTPLANFLLLNSDIRIDYKGPEDIIKDSENSELEKDLEELMKKKQISFNDNVIISIDELPQTDRSSVTEIKLNNSLPLEEIEKIYEQTFDDHNFSFVTQNNVEIEEVEGSQKIVIHFEKPEPDILKVRVVADSRLRGGAGDMVHIMNLFFGLHEKTGLNLKPSRYNRIK